MKPNRTAKSVVAAGCLSDKTTMETKAAEPPRPTGLISLAFSVVSVALASGALLADVVTDPTRVFGYGSLKTMDISPDGRLLLTGGSQGVFVWDRGSGTPVQDFREIYRGDFTSVEQALFTSDGQHVVTASCAAPVSGHQGEYSVRLLHIGRGDVVREFEGSAAYTGLHIAVAGDLLAAGGGDTGSRVRIWRISTGEVVRDIQVNVDGLPVSCVALSVDGARLAAGSRRGPVRLWDLETGNLGSTLEPVFDNSAAVAFSPDGQRLVAGGTEQVLGASDPSRAVMWDIASGNVIYTLELESYPNQVEFAPDGASFVTIGGKVTQWNTATGDVIRTFESQQDSIYSPVVFAPDGTTILWCESPGQGRVIQEAQVETGTVLRTYARHLPYYDLNLFSADFGKVVLAGLSKPETVDTATVPLALDAGCGTRVTYSPRAGLALAGHCDGTVELWDVQSGHVMHALQGHTDAIHAVAISSDQSCLLSSSGQEARLWETESGALVRVFDGCSRTMESVAFSADGTKLLTGPCLWERDTGVLVQSYPEGECAGFSPDGNRVWTFTRGYQWGYWLWNIESGRLEHSVLQDDAFAPQWDEFLQAVSPDGSRLLFGGDGFGRRAGLFDVATQKFVREFVPSESVGDYVATEFWPNGHYVVTSGNDGTVQLWDIRDLLARPRRRVSATGSEVRWDLGVLQFSPFVDGPWTDLPAGNPFPLSPIGPRGFFRVRVDP